MFNSLLRVLLGEIALLLRLALERDLAMAYLVICTSLLCLAANDADAADRFYLPADPGFTIPSDR